MTPNSTDRPSGEEFVRSVKDRIQKVTLEVECAVDENRYPRFVTVLCLTDALLSKGIAILARVLA